MLAPLTSLEKKIFKQIKNFDTPSISNALELIDPASDNSLAASWQGSWVVGGTPGAPSSTEPDFTCCRSPWTSISIEIECGRIQFRWTPTSIGFDID